MSVKLSCPVKINLTLRVFSQRADGYHEIYSLFWRKKATEGLTIVPSNDENIGDFLKVKGLDLRGPNIVTKTAEWARKNGCELPFLSMELEKKYPDGSGIGAGSGNAAALIEWLRQECGFVPPREAIAKLGADVAFLAGSSDVALAEGIGERLTALEPLPNQTRPKRTQLWTLTERDVGAARRIIERKHLNKKLQKYMAALHRAEKPDFCQMIFIKFCSPSTLNTCRPKKFQRVPELSHGGFAAAEAHLSLYAKTVKQPRKQNINLTAWNG